MTHPTQTVSLFYTVANGLEMTNKIWYRPSNIRQVTLKTMKLFKILMIKHLLDCFNHKLVDLHHPMVNAEAKEHSKSDTKCIL